MLLPVLNQTIFPTIVGLTTPSPLLQFAELITTIARFSTVRRKQLVRTATAVDEGVVAVYVDKEEMVREEVAPEETAAN